MMFDIVLGVLLVISVGIFLYILKMNKKTN